MASLPENFDLHRALCLARASCAAYKETHEEMVLMLAESQLRGTLHPFASADTEGFLFVDEDQVILSFRGSVSVGDWINNTSISLRLWPGEGFVHTGFASALDAVWPEVAALLERYAAGRTLWFTGHSLGGALAMLAAVKYRTEAQGSVDGVYTFGMPKVGNQKFTAAVDSLLKGRAFAILNEGDFVPWLPFMSDDFDTCAVGLRFDRQGRLQPRPGMLGAALLMLTGLLDKPQEEWLNLKPHRKDEYLRLLEAAVKGIA
jgi:triacylglycerol lipase